MSASIRLQVCSTCPTPTESDESPTMTTSTTDVSPTTLLETQHSGTTSNVTSAIVGGDTTASPDDGTPIYNTDTTGEVPISRDGMINMRTGMEYDSLTVTTAYTYVFIYLLHACIFFDADEEDGTSRSTIGETISNSNGNIAAIAAGVAVGGVVLGIVLMVVLVVLVCRLRHSYDKKDGTCYSIVTHMHVHV